MSCQTPPKHAWTDAPADDDAPTQDPVGEKKVSIPAKKRVCAEKDRISVSRRIIFAAPTVATLPFVAMWGMHGNKNYQAFGASLGIIALFTALARSFDVVSDPLVSYWTDSSNCQRMPRWLRGRRKPFMFFGCFAYSLFLWLLLNPPYWGQAMLSVWFGVFYTLYFLSNTITCIPYDALAPELSEDSDQRTGLFFVANLFDGIGTLIALGLPIMMTSFAGMTTRNEAICKDDSERASLCLAGKSCGHFISEGWSSSYTSNETLVSIFSASPTFENTTAATAASGLNYTWTTLSDPSRVCMKWLDSRVMEDSVLVASEVSGLGSPAQNDAFCVCMGTCADSCTVANSRTGFMLVGTIFAIWFIVTMVIAVCRVPERPLPQTPAKAPPIVPSMRTALSNKPFRVLLPAWLCDAFVTALFQSLVPFFVEAVVAPAYQTMEDHGRDCVRSSPGYIKDGKSWNGEAGRSDSPDYDPWCSTSNVFTVAGVLALITALVCCPIWNILVSRMGKTNAWLMWSLTMAATNLMLVCVPKGQIYLFWFICAVNGAPLGAKFLQDAILADIIDYDEFLTGMRSEATYFMFKSFFPKIVQIPAAAIPIALLASFGYRDPEGGKFLEQPESVAIYIRVVVFLGFMTSCISFLIKRGYPLKDARVEMLHEGLLAHHVGNHADDPISNLPYKPTQMESQQEQEYAWLFTHFTADHIRQEFKEVCLKRVSQLNSDTADSLKDGVDALMKSTLRHLIVACLFLFSALGGSAGTLSLLSSERFQFVPTLFVVCVGVGISACGYTFLRRRAAKKLYDVARADAEGLSKCLLKLLAEKSKLDKLGANVDDGHGGMFLAPSLQKMITGMTSGTSRKDLAQDLNANAEVQHSDAPPASSLAASALDDAPTAPDTQAADDAQAQTSPSIQAVHTPKNVAEQLASMASPNEQASSHREELDQAQSEPPESAVTEPHVEA